MIRFSVWVTGCWTAAARGLTYVIREMADSHRLEVWDDNGRIHESDHDTWQQAEQAAREFVQEASA